MGAQKPKQFLTLGGESLLKRSVRRFRAWGYLKNLVLVSHRDFIEETEREVGELLVEGDRIVEGGDTRHKSTLRGIEGLEEIGLQMGDYVFFHDVARPFFLHTDLDALVKSARKVGSSTLAVPCSDTLIRVQNRVESSLSREGVWQVKTPQIASYANLVEARQCNSPTEPTDLCTWFLAADKKPGVVGTGDWNMKITRPGDLELAEVYRKGLQFLGANFQ